MTQAPSDRWFALELRTLLFVIAFVLAGAVSAIAALGMSLLVEYQTEKAMKTRFLENGITWVTAEADGLQVLLKGIAPNEAERYRVVNIAGVVIEASRIRDNLEVVPIRAFEAPDFSLEMLRNDDGIQLIGLVPEGETRDGIIETSQGLSGNLPISDMIERAAYPPPESWNDALTFGMEALTLLPRSKISVNASGVNVTAIATSEAEKRDFETRLAAMAPATVAVTMDISAPRPVLTPFTLRFVRDDKGARFDSCSADTDAAMAAILAAGAAADADSATGCLIGLGVPTPSWSKAAAAGIAAVAAIGQGTITFKDADVTLLAAPSTDPEIFDLVIGELESNLPDVFSLEARIEKAPDSKAEGPASFTATLAAKTGKVEIRGRLPDDMIRNTVEKFAEAKFGVANVLLATRTDPNLPKGWPVRVLAGLEALGELDHGSLLVQEGRVEIRGVTGSQRAKAIISQNLSSRLGKGQTFVVEVTYDEKLDPILSIPTPEKCIQNITRALLKKKITFTPGSAEIDGTSQAAIDDIARILKPCAGTKIEVSGHTDSQGSDQGNLSLSQARAEAVVIALQGRQVDVLGLISKGYGELQPIGDNDTKQGQEANRRIEFRLLEKADAAGTSEPATETGAETATGTESASSGAVAESQPATAATDGATDPAATRAATDKAVSEQAEPAAPPGSETSEGDPALASPSTPEEPSGESHDFSNDQSPSVAPTEKTIGPAARPETDG